MTGTRAEFCRVEQRQTQRSFCAMNRVVQLLTTSNVENKVMGFVFSPRRVPFFLDRQERDWNASLYKEVFHE